MHYSGMGMTDHPQCAGDLPSDCGPGKLYSGMGMTDHPQCASDLPSD